MVCIPANPIVAKARWETWASPANAGAAENTRTEAIAKRLFITNVSKDESQTGADSRNGSTVVATSKSMLGYQSKEALTAPSTTHLTYFVHFYTTRACFPSGPISLPHQSDS